MGKRYENLKSLRTFYRPYRGRLAAYIGLSLLSAAVVLTYPFLSSNIIVEFTAEKFGLMAKYAVALFLAVILWAALNFAAEFLYTRISAGLFRDFRHAQAWRMLRLKLPFIYSAGSGYFSERFFDDSKEACVLFLDNAEAIVQLFANLTFIAYISVLQWQLGLILVFGVAVIVFTEYFRVTRLLKNKRMMKRANERTKANENELFKGIKEIKGMNGAAAAMARHRSLTENYAALKSRRELFDKGMTKTVAVIKAALELLLLLIAGLYLVPRGQIEVLAALVVYNYRGNIYDLVNGVARLRSNFENGELAAKRMNDILAAPKESTDVFGDRELSGSIETIEFKNVAFGYDDSRKVLKDIDLSAGKNSLVGFVGKSGSGKSTIFSLLLRYFNHQSGDILINGVPIGELSEPAVRGHITPVLQDPYIFNETVMDNVRFARPDASDAEVIEACRAAQLHDEIMEMERGYETMIGESGSNLSGGQKQRMEIARAILKNTDVILFDEATSALDKANLTRINDLLLELKKTKIVLVIAHRLNIMRRCDEVFVLDDGEIIARGAHKDLIETCDYYKTLFKRGEAAAVAAQLQTNE